MIALQVMCKINGYYTLSEGCGLMVGFERLKDYATYKREG